MDFPVLVDATIDHLHLFELETGSQHGLPRYRRPRLCAHLGEAKKKDIRASQLAPGSPQRQTAQTAWAS
jgi:hypothetical protein